MTHSINAIPIQQQAVGPAQKPLASELQMYANLCDAVKLLNAMIDRTKYSCTAEEAELLWRLRFVTRIQP